MKENPFKVGQEVSDDLKKVILEKDTFGSDTEWYCHRNAKVPNLAEADALRRKYQQFENDDPVYKLWDFLDGNGFKSPLDDDSLKLAGLVRVEKEKP